MYEFYLAFVWEAGVTVARVNSAELYQLLHWMSCSVSSCMNREF